MQAIRNKLTGKSKRSDKKRASIIDQPNMTLAPEPITPAPSVPGAIVTEFSESHKDLPSGAHVDHFEKSEIIPAATSVPVSEVTTAPVVEVITAPVLVSEFPSESVRTMEVLPVEVIEKPVVIHESIRQEQVEEIQPVVRVEREKTEIRQITQPLTDREIRPVLIEERTLPVEVLPTIIDKAVPAPERFEVSTRDFDATRRQVIEKTPIVQETEKWRIIEEVQPIIYREVVVPHVIRTSRPMREVIVEAPIFTEQVLVSRQITPEERLRWSSLFSKETIVRESMPVPVSTISEPLAVRVINEPIQKKKEIVEEVITTTTTTTVAPVVAASRAGLARSSSSTAPISAAPVVLNESHDVKLGPKGEVIRRDSFTTTQANVLPTRAN